MLTSGADIGTRQWTKKEDAIANPSEIQDAARKNPSRPAQQSAENRHPSERIYKIREAGELLRYQPSYIDELVRRGDLAAIRHGKNVTISRIGNSRDFIKRNERRGE